MSNEQALKLFVQVVQVACDIKKNRPVSIVIDGVDEMSRTCYDISKSIQGGSSKCEGLPIKGK